MRQMLAALQGFLAARDGGSETSVLVKATRHHVPDQFVGLSPLLSGGAREPCFKLGGEMNFHALSRYGKAAAQASRQSAVRPE